MGRCRACVVAVVGMFVAVGCSGGAGPGPSGASPASIGAAVGATATACASRLEAVAPSPPREPAALADVRVASHGTTDRIVFEFAGPDVPAFDIEPARPPFVADGSGLPVAVPGAEFLRVHLPFATGMSTYAGPSSFAAPASPGGTLASLVRTGDYEAVMTWVVGLRSPACYRVEILGGPTRIVIDLVPAGG